jgi:aspartyl-tRNA(Asn)/glutamyl-tRNA(Gln) amidotransferase subunit A
VIDEDTLYLPAVELSRRIRARSLSPLALTEAYLERSSRIGKQLNAYAALMPERALDEARAAEKELAAGKWRGPLHGLPYAAKDLLAATGAPTTWGAKPFATQRFDRDALAIRKLHDAGAILLGKAAMIELAGGFGYQSGRSSLTGGTKNPWDPTRWTCGSSSGSAAIVSAGLAAFALGSETFGSILCPCSHCGVTGLRPTHGRISLEGAMPLAPSLDKIGPIARCAQDCALVLAALSETPFDAAARPRRPLKIGWITAQARGIPEERAAVFVKARAALSAAGFSVEDAELPDGQWWAPAVIMIQFEAARSFAGLIASGRIAELSDAKLRLRAYVAAEIERADYDRALAMRERARPLVASVFERFDVLAGPATAATAIGLDENLDQATSFPNPMGALGNLLGLPSLVTPAAQVGGLPIGLQLMARASDEASALAVASRLQETTDWHKQKPNLH